MCRETKYIPRFDGFPNYYWLNYRPLENHKQKYSAILWTKTQVIGRIFLWWLSYDTIAVNNHQNSTQKGSVWQLQPKRIYTSTEIVTFIAFVKYIFRYIGKYWCLGAVDQCCNMHKCNNLYSSNMLTSAVSTSSKIHSGEPTCPPRWILNNTQAQVVKTKLFISCFHNK